LLGETLRLRQVVGIAIAMGGLAAFLLLNQRGERTKRREALVEPPLAGEGSVAPAVT
jgi:hypothetical protein